MDQITRKESCSFTGGAGGAWDKQNRCNASLLQAELKQRKAEEIARKARCDFSFNRNTPIFHGKTMVSCRFSLKPIHCFGLVIWRSTTSGTRINCPITFVQFPSWCRNSWQPEILNSAFLTGLKRKSIGNHGFSHFSPSKIGFLSCRFSL